MGPFSAQNQASARGGGRRELDARGTDGLDVRLWCYPADGRVAVTVADGETGLGLEVPVGDGGRRQIERNAGSIRVVR